MFAYLPALYFVSGVIGFELRVAGYANSNRFNKGSDIPVGPNVTEDASVEQFTNRNASGNQSSFAEVSEAALKYFNIDRSKLISTDPEDIQFYIFPRPNNPKFRKELQLEDTDAFTEGYYKPEKKLVLIIHGLEASIDSEYTQDLKNALLTAKSIFNKNNIMVVNWGRLASVKNKDYSFLAFSIGAGNAMKVGIKTSELLSLLLKLGSLKSLKDVHIIGFGAGAQIAAYASRALNVSNMGKIGRISGLDPTGKLQALGGSIHLKLRKKYTEFIDVYHTDRTRRGLSKPAGHVDFFINGGGPYQPGCDDNPDSSNNKTDLSAIVGGLCAHLKAVEYYILSIQDPTYKGCECANILDVPCMTLCEKSAVFGYGCNPSSTGEYRIIMPRNTTAPAEGAVKAVQRSLAIQRSLF